ETLQAKRPDLYTEAIRQSKEMLTASVLEKAKAHNIANSASISNTPTPKPREEKTLVFRYPLFWRIFMFFSVAFFGRGFLLIATVNVVNSLHYLVIALMFGISVKVYFQKVEITDEVIRGSSIFNSTEAKWGEITSMQSIARKLMLTKSNGD